MTGVLHSDVFDFGLEEIVERTDLICLVVNAPTQYALTTAGSANLIGFKAFDPGDAFDAPASDEVGRYVASANIVDGTTVSTGTAQFVGVVDTLRGRVLAYHQFGVGGAW